MQECKGGRNEGVHGRVRAGGREGQPERGRVWMHGRAVTPVDVHGGASTRMYMVWQACIRSRVRVCIQSRIFMTSLEPLLSTSQVFARTLEVEVILQ